MKEMRLAILFSGNGSNLENVYRKMQGVAINLCKASKISPNQSKQNANSSIVDEKSGLRRHELGNKTDGLLTKRVASLPDLSPQDEFATIKLNFILAVSSNESAFGIQRCANIGLQCEVVDYKKNKADFFEKIMQILQNHKIDLVILAGFMRILPPAFNAKFRAINIHPSILPLFKGANAIRESFESDMKIAGVSVHFVSDELDGGALIMQDIIHKIEGESLEDFEGRIHELEYEIYPKAIIRAIQMVNDSLCGNLSWGMRFRTCENFGESTDLSLVFSPKFSQIQKPHRHYFDCRLSQNPHDSAESTLDSTIPQNLTRENHRISHEVRKSFCYFWLKPKVESLLPYQPQLTSDSTIPQNLIENNVVRSTRKLARFVVQKIGIKGAEVPPADFLLETDKRGTPPKSEKAAAFWRVGGEWRGVQPFLRKESSEIEGEGIVDSTDSCV